jgi:hypothetical protein
MFVNTLKIIRTVSEKNCQCSIIILRRVSEGTYQLTWMESRADFFNIIRGPPLSVFQDRKVHSKNA